MTLCLGSCPRALLVRAGRGGQRPQGVGIQGNNLTRATIAFIARGWRRHSHFTSLSAPGWVLAPEPRGVLSLF